MLNTKAGFHSIIHRIFAWYVNQSIAQDATLRMSEY